MGNRGLGLFLPDRLFLPDGPLLPDPLVVGGLGIESKSESRMPTLSALTNAIGSEDGGLRQAHSRLSALVGAVKELLDANASFAGKAQEQVQSTLRLLGRLMPDDPTYGPGIQGSRTGANSGGRLVQRTA